MRIAIAADVGRFDVQLPHTMLHLPLIAMQHAERLGRDHRQLMVGQIDDSLRVAGQRRAVARQKMLPIADADHQRAAQPRGE